MKKLIFGFLLVLFCLVFWQDVLLSEYTITLQQIEEIKKLYEEQNRLTGIILHYSKEKKELLQNLQDIENQREIDLKEKEEFQREKEELRKEKNSIIVERENELKIVGKSIAGLEKEKAILKKSLKLSRKQLEEEKKLSRKSWPGIIDFLIWGVIAILSFFAGRI